MQPTRRQVPPKRDSLSMQAVLNPSWAARMAATYPPGPAPITTTSNVSNESATPILLIITAVQGSNLTRGGGTCQSRQARQIWGSRIRLQPPKGNADRHCLARSTLSVRLSRKCCESPNSPICVIWRMSFAFQATNQRVVRSKK